jgi:hypothetical protein
MRTEMWTSFWEVRLLRRVEEDPGTNVRRTAAAESVIWRILHEQSHYPYHISDCKLSLLLIIVQGGVLSVASRKMRSNTQFVANILFTDQSGFTRDGIVNCHNAHVWVDDSSHNTVTSRHKHRFAINVWVGILGDELLGPVIIVFWWMIYQYSWSMCLFTNDSICGSVTRFLCVVREHLHQTFGEQWIGCGGPVIWPARSPDLNPLDFWLRGHVKALVYSAPINDFEGLEQRVENVC